MDVLFAMGRKFLLLIMLFLLLLPMKAEGAKKRVTLSANQALDFARKSMGKGDVLQGKRDYRAALDIIPVAKPLWKKTLIDVARQFPELVEEFFNGVTDHRLTLARLPEDPFEEAEIPLLHIPEDYGRLSFLPPKLASLVRFYQRRGQWKKAATKLEEYLDEQPNNLKLLALLGSIYERAKWLDVAKERYLSALQKAEMSEDKYRYRFDLLRLVLRHDSMFESEQIVQEYINDTEASFEEFATGRNVKMSESGARDRYMMFRRQLAFAYNLFGAIKMLKGQPREARDLFARALTEAGGRPIIALNTNQMLRGIVERDKAVYHLRQLFTIFSDIYQNVESLAKSAKSLGGGAEVSRLRRAANEAQRAVADVAMRLGRMFIEDKQDATAIFWFEKAIAIVPDDALPRYYIGLIKEKEKDLQRAQLYFRQALARAEKRPFLRQACQEKIEGLFEEEAREILRSKPRKEKIAEKAQEKLDVLEMQELHEGLVEGRQMLVEGKFKEAFYSFRKLSRLYPQCADAKYYRGLAALLAGSVSKAIDGFLSALEVDSDHALTLSHIAYLKMERNIDLSGALEQSKRAFEAKPSEPVILVNHAWILFRLGERREAYKLIKAALDRSPRDPIFHYRVGLMYFRDGLYDFALAKFKEVNTLLNDYPRALMMEGLCLARLGRIEEALERLSLSIDGLARRRGSRVIVKDTVQALKEALVSRASGTKALKSGRRTSSRLAAVTVEEALYNSEARSLQEQAVKTCIIGNVDRAKSLLKQGVEQFPRYANISVDLGFLEVLDGKLQEAKDDFDRVLDYQGAEFRALSGYAHINFRNGDMIRFSTDIERLRDIPPTLAYSQLLDAIRDRWQRVLSIIPKDAEAHYHLGRAQLLSGNCAEALKTLEQAKGPELELLRGEAYLRLFILNEKDEDYDKAKTHLSAARFRHLAKLPDLRAYVTRPAPTPPIEEKKPVIVELKASEGWSMELREAIKRKRPQYWQDWLFTNKQLKRWKRVDKYIEDKHASAKAMVAREEAIEEQMWKEGRALVHGSEPITEEKTPQPTVKNGGASKKGNPAKGGPGKKKPGGDIDLDDDDDIDLDDDDDIDLDDVEGPLSKEAPQYASRGIISPEDILAAARLSTAMPIERSAAPPLVIKYKDEEKSRPQVHLLPQKRVRPQIPLSPETKTKLDDGMDYLQKGLVRDALNLFKEAVNDEPKSERVHIALITAQLLAERYEDLEADLSKALDYHKSSVFLERARALLAHRRGEEHPPVLSDEAVVTVRETIETKALASMWDKFLSDEPEDGDSNVQRGMIAFLNGKWDQLQSCEKRVRNPFKKKFLSYLVKASAGADFDLPSER